MLLAVGTAVLWLALAPLGALPGPVKISAVVIGVAAMYLGLREVGRAVWGPEWDGVMWLAIGWLAGLSLAAVFADALPLSEHVDISKTLAEPGNTRPDLLSAHPLGTNNFSLDLLARSIHGARISLPTAMLAISVTLIVGGSTGIIAGLRRGWFDRTTGMLTDSLLAFPAIVLLVALATIAGIPDSAPEAIWKSGVALGFVGIPTMVRLARSLTLGLANSEFVLASRVLGASRRQVVVADVLPNVAPALLSYSLILIAVLIVAEGSLAFIGLGLQPPTPTWGSMIAEGDFTTLAEHPHIPLVPGAFMLITVLSLNLLGERATAKWNPSESQL
ncbi:ABC transporter permease [Candidatus Poriferisocius sp.]|uniref:ABC transporter permease n=1 Tax=Candidatus Poriferisocius sp. TaxID=3101276 RepID=UPI003B5BF6CB